MNTEYHILSKQLLDQFPFQQTPKRMLPTEPDFAAWLLDNRYYLKESGRNALELILSKNINLNDRFDEDFELSEFDSLLGVMFFAHPILFMEALENRPDDEVIDNLPWDFIISES